MSISADNSLAAMPARSPASNLPTSDLNMYWVWVHVVVAALAMVATLPGRTHGLGLVTEPLLQDLDLNRLDYAAMNLWATLVGALFCLPCGWLIDRLGTRMVLTGVLLGLGAVVVVMSNVQADWLVFSVRLPTMSNADPARFACGLFLLILLTRGFGQSALSVVSLALVGRSAKARPGPAFGVYAFVVAIGFTAAFGAIKYAFDKLHSDWRSVWRDMGLAVLIFAFVAFFLVRSPKSSAPANAPVSTDNKLADGSWTLGEALRSPTFWVFGIATSLYGAVAAGVSLFNQSILEERGFDRSVFLTISIIGSPIGLASNLTTGWLATRWSMNRLLCGAMLVLAAALALFPWVSSLAEVYTYAVCMGVVGGMVTVLFFAVWSHTFGSTHLGKIQGVAQMLTVVASALGPLALAASKERFGSYVPLFYYFAVTSALLGIAAWITPVRKARRNGGMG